MAKSPGSFIDLDLSRAMDAELARIEEAEIASRRCACGAPATRFFSRRDEENGCCSDEECQGNYRGEWMCHFHADEAELQEAEPPAEVETPGGEKF